MLTRLVDQNPVLNFVLLRLPLGQHVACSALADFSDDAAKFRRTLYSATMTTLLEQFGVYVSKMTCRGAPKGIVLLGPGVAKPVDACSQPLGTSRNLLRVGSMERAELIQQWCAPHGTARKLRADDEGVRMWTPARTPGRGFDPRRVVLAAEALLDEETVEDAPLSSSVARSDSERFRTRLEWYELAQARRDKIVEIHAELAAEKADHARFQVFSLRDVHEAKHESAQSAMREEALEQRLGECGALVVQLQAAPKSAKVRAPVADKQLGERGAFVVQLEAGLKIAEEREAVADTQLGERVALVGQLHAGLKKSILIKLVLACARAVS
jgi:hypothetical protein